MMLNVRPVGHFARTEPQVGSCSSYVAQVVPGCSANFQPGAAADAAVAAQRTPAPRAIVAKIAKAVWQAASPAATNKTD